MADVDVHADTGDTLRVHHRDGSITLVVWLDHGEAALVLPPHVIEETRDRRRRRRKTYLEAIRGPRGADA